MTFTFQGNWHLSHYYTGRFTGWTCIEYWTSERTQGLNSIIGKWFRIYVWRFGAMYTNKKFLEKLMTPNFLQMFQSVVRLMRTVDQELHNLVIIFCAHFPLILISTKHA
jgi:hypothetical protein